MSDQRRSLVMLGFWQALGVVVYVLLVGFVITSFDDTIEGPQLLGIAMMLTLLVFSAGVTGSLVFARAVLLGMRGETKQALQLVAWTLIWLLILWLILVIIAATVNFQPI